MGDPITIVVRDTDIAERETQLQISLADRTEQIKTMICQVWPEWITIEMVLLDAGRNELRDGCTVADCNLKQNQIITVTSRSSLLEAALKNRKEKSKTEDGDAEKWGVFGHAHDKKVSIKIRQNDVGHTSASLTWLNEGHTLGNTLRHALIQNPSVLQCGYSIPHPLEPSMVMELTSKIYPPELVAHSLESLAVLCQHSADTFAKACTDFENRMED